MVFYFEIIENIQFLKENFEKIVFVHLFHFTFSVYF
jgi:hypothetical protein